MYVHGSFPENQIDHINGDKSNNALCNIRKATSSENSKNVPVSKRNKLGIMGIRWDERRNYWQARITSNGVELHLGTTKCFFSACCMRKSAELKYGFHFNHGRRGICLKVKESRYGNPRN